MLTRCPSCQTVFRLRPEQLRVAQGRVRCSRCLHVFDGLEHLHTPANQEQGAALAPHSSDTTSPELSTPVAPDTAGHETPSAYPPPQQAHPTTSGFELLDDEHAQHSPAIDSQNKASPTTTLGAETAIQEDTLNATVSPEQADREPDHDLPRKQDAIDFDALLAELEPPVSQADEPEPEPEPESVPESESEPEPGTRLDSRAPDLPLEELDLAIFPEQGVDDEDALDDIQWHAERGEVLDEHTLELDTGMEAGSEDEPVTEKVGAEVPPADTPSTEPSPAATGQWDDFSEQHIETLLTPTEEEALRALEQAGTDTPAAPIIQQAQEPDHENDLPDPFAPLPEEEYSSARQQEDEALLNQLLPEDDSELELDHTLELDQLALQSTSRQVDGNRSGTSGGFANTPAATATFSATAEGRDTSADRTTSAPIAAQQQDQPGKPYTLGPEPVPSARRKLTNTLLWGGGILLLLVTLAGQFVYFQHAGLGKHAQWRPLVDQLCRFTNCELPAQRDLERLRLSSHLVQFHPGYHDSLLITATLINRAEFEQPFPEIELQMTDVQQQVVASRRFLPQEYLINQRDATLLPRNIEIPLMLEVLDPGREVVGFRFEFH